MVTAWKRLREACCDFEKNMRSRKLLAVLTTRFKQFLALVPPCDDMDEMVVLHRTMEKGTVGKKRLLRFKTLMLRFCPRKQKRNRDRDRKHALQLLQRARLELEKHPEHKKKLATFTSHFQNLVFVFQQGTPEVQSILQRMDKVHEAIRDTVSNDTPLERLQLQMRKQMQTHLQEFKLLLRHFRVGRLDSAPAMPAMLALERLRKSRCLLEKNLRKRKYLSMFSKHFESLQTHTDCELVQEMARIHDKMVAQKRATLQGMERFRQLLSRKLRLMKQDTPVTSRGIPNDGERHPTVSLPPSTHDRMIGRFYMFKNVLVQWDGFHLCCKHKVRLNNCKTCKEKKV